jgi:DNA-binding MarR family transcriptional regulator
VTPEATSALARARRERTAFLVRGLATLTDDERELLARAVPLLDRLVGVE